MWAQSCQALIWLCLLLFICEGHGIYLFPILRWGQFNEFTFLFICVWPLPLYIPHLTLGASTISWLPVHIYGKPLENDTKTIENCYMKTNISKKFAYVYLHCLVLGFACLIVQLLRVYAFVLFFVCEYFVRIHFFFLRLDLFLLVHVEVCFCMLVSHGALLC